MEKNKSHYQAITIHRDITPNESEKESIREYFYEEFRLNPFKEIDVSYDEKEGYILLIIFNVHTFDDTSVKNIVNFLADTLKVDTKAITIQVLLPKKTQFFIWPLGWKEQSEK